MGVHQTLAMRAGQHWALQPDEARQLAASLMAVHAYFPAVQVDPKWIAIGSLVVTGASIYGPRLAASAIIAKMNQGNRQAAPPRTVAPAAEMSQRATGGAQAPQNTGAAPPQGFDPFAYG